MKIPKAIEILTYKLQFLNYSDLADFKQAIQLGIEALKYTQDVRFRQSGEHYKLLPGETKE